MVCFAFGLSVSAQWTRTAGPEGGFAAAFANLPDCILVGLEQGGIYRSTDVGATWQYACAGLTGNNPGGEAFATIGTYVFVVSGYGIYKSVDQGLTWTPSSNGLPPLGLSITSLVAGGSNLFLGSYGAGVYQSQDSGATWTRASNGLADTNLLSLLYTPPYLYAGTDRSGVFRSTDDGGTWQPASNGLAAGDGFEILSLAAAPGIVIAGTRAGAYRSTNNGDSWTLATSGLTSTGVASLFALGSDIFAGTYGSGVYRSSNGGVDWEKSSQGWTAGNVRAFCVSGGVLLGGNYGRPVVYRSTDNGGTWTPSGNGITSQLIYAMAVSDHNVLAGTLDGVEISNDSGSTWVTPASLPSHASMYSFVTRAGVIFVGTAGQGVYTSSDEGSTWSNATGDLPAGNSLIINSLATDASYLYAGTPAGVYRSSNEGGTWTAAKNGMTDTMTLSLCSANGTLLAGTYKGMYRSTDSGSSWTPITNGLPIYRIISIVSVDSILLAAYGFGGNPTVYKSTDDGLSWNPVSNGLAANAMIWRLLVVGKDIFGGTTAAGVWRSSDQGDTWSDVGEGLSGPGMVISGLAASGTHLYAGATKGGVWRRPLSEVVTSVREDETPGVVRVYRLEQNYPNPFNPRTVVSSQLPVPSNVKLVVYDVLGREVAVLANERRAAGGYQDTFDGTGLVSGVYIYRLTAGTFMQTRKMILIK